MLRYLTAGVIAKVGQVSGGAEMKKYITKENLEEYRNYPELFTVQQHQPLSPGQLLYFN